MIDAREVKERAAELSLDPQVVEKDYVLGWLLAGIDRHAEVGRSWVFKGGTCLKKVHFETYRFSEDLDFTLTEESQLSEGFLRDAFADLTRWVYEQCGIEIPPDQTRFDSSQNKRGRATIEGRVYYRGPLQRRASFPKVKLDLTADEVVVLEPTRLRVVHSYTDEPADGIYIRCYPYAEIFAEKIRALGERGRPRDLYDVINLFRHEEARDLAVEVHRILAAKSAHKGISATTLESVEQHREELETDWEIMLRHQLPALPPFAAYWAELAGFFGWLEQRVAPAVAAHYPLGPGEQVLRVATGTLATLGMPARPLEAIRFAAANHLCVDLAYKDEHGRRSTRMIEPYSLRRTAQGAILLHAERADGGGHRAYRVERIEGATVTGQTFAPRFAIELSPTGHQPAPLERRALGALERAATSPPRRTPARRPR